MVEKLLHSSQLQTVASTLGEYLFGVDAEGCALDKMEINAVINNSFLSGATQSKAQQLLKKAEDHLVPLNGKIAHLEAILENLQLQRGRTITQIDLYRTAGAPIRRMPNEMLAHVFLLLCSDPSHKVSTPFKADEQPWVLGRVCSKWRSVSLGLHELWRNIHIDYSNNRLGAHVAIQSTAFVTMVEELVRRSGVTPLTVSITGTPGSAVRPLDPFMSELGRIIGLRIEKNPNAIKSFLASSPGDVSSLHTLELSGPSDVEFNNASVLLNARSLRKFTFTAQAVPSTWIYKLPLRQLTHLILPSTILRPDHVLSILDLAPMLVECALAVGTLSAELFSSIPEYVDLSLPIEHCISSLHLNYFATDGEAIGLQRLILPNLRHFVFQTGQERIWDHKWTPTIIKSALLETLVLRDVHVSSQQLERLLLATPHLTELDVSSGQMLASPILHKFATGALVPKLNTLCCLIGVTRMEEFGSLDLHLNMLKYRRMETCPASHIATVQFVLLGAGDMNIIFPGLDRLKKMNEDGWKITTMLY